MKETKKILIIELFTDIPSVRLKKVAHIGLQDGERVRPVKVQVNVIKQVEGRAKFAKSIRW